MKDDEKKVGDPQELIILAAQMLGWCIAMPPEDENGDIHGLVIGTQEFINNSLLDPEEFDVMAISTEPENGEEI